MRAGTYLDADKNGPQFNRIPVYLCPSQTDNERSNLGVPPSGDTDQINGIAPFTNHYPGIMGPNGTNLITGLPYATVTIAGDSATHGYHATQGVLIRDEPKKRAIRTKDITDGTSKTFMVGELSWTGFKNYRGWGRGPSVGSSGFRASAEANIKSFTQSINSGASASFNDGAFGSMHPGGAHFLFADGSARLISDTTSLAILMSAASRDGAESVGVP